MGSRYEVEVTVGSAKDLKNVNWRNGDLKPYAVLWIDDGPKCSTRVDLDNGENPVWDEKVAVPLPPTSRLEDALLRVDIVHANAQEGTKPLVGSARLQLRDVIDDAGLGGRASRTLRLKRPSGRPQGRLDVRVSVRECSRYYDPSYPVPASYGKPAGSRDMYAPGGYGQQPYGAAPQSGYPAAYGAAPLPSGYPVAGPYGAVPPPSGYPAAPYGAAPQPAYGAAQQPAYGSGGYGSSAAAPMKDQSTKKKGMGMGTGLAVGAAAGVLGGLALAEGASFLEHKIEDDVADKVEADMARDDMYGDGYDDDDY